MTPEEKEMMWLIVKRDQKQKAIIVAAFERVLCMAGGRMHADLQSGRLGGNN